MLLTLLIAGLAVCVIAAILGGLSMAIGLVLTVCIDGLQLGHAVIAGSIIAVATVDFLRRLVTEIDSATDSDDDIGHEEAVLVLPRDIVRHLRGGSKSKRRRG